MPGAGTGEVAPLMCGPGHNAGHLNPFKSVNSIQMNLILNQTRLNFIWSKKGLPKLEKFEIKYGWKVVEIRNNFPYRNFSRIEMDFE
jgi:hypothetical protein